MARHAALDRRIGVRVPAPQPKQNRRALATEAEVKAGVPIHPTRMALTGAQAGPPLFDVVAAMGREPSLAHLRRLAGFLRRNRPPGGRTPEG